MSQRASADSHEPRGGRPTWIRADRAALGLSPARRGIAAAADYPDAPVSRVLDATTPGAELFAVLVAIGGGHPTPHHPVMELQFVLAGHGLALDADGGETPIAPAAWSSVPAGPAGAHGFRNTGSLPLQLLCIYPSPGGATPGRRSFDLGTPFEPGPRTTYTPPQLTRPATADYPDAPVARLLDEQRPGRRALRRRGRHRRGHPAPLPSRSSSSSSCSQGTAWPSMPTAARSPIAPGGTVISPAGPDRSARLPQRRARCRCAPLRLPFARRGRAQPLTLRATLLTGRPSGRLRPRAAWTSSPWTVFDMPRGVWVARD